ncbi:hypothetical protein PC9H_002159 [Pleurotus ostreatus]|uniref:Uncharacterized protein n=1 Tax=Pleurotus ostreatus TaxID=5322 RepID=A0A8H6ZI26_PLEOS|nr:uncharacterized protein PC9H_002159 [Pleurotus ostreatus]KAF7419568.1 hypothetical protein PC9H_002159 [Pleurotus ostreatus]KAJ8689588.1 hypothetical protein PTI98_012478 [Pleurotus ostreatus]
MEVVGYVALTVFALYFFCILWLFHLILSNISKQAFAKSWGQLTLFASLTTLSFAHTWYYMFKFMQWSFVNYEESIYPNTSAPLIERMAQWLVNTQLFKQAWYAVCDGPLNWWWSEQLCLFTVGCWTVILASEGTYHRVEHVWAYMLLGQLVAISVASNLFYIAILSSPIPREAAKQSSSRAPATLWVSVLLALATVGLSPYTTSRTFLPNLLVMHALLVVPLLPPFLLPYVTHQQRPIRVRTLYGLVLFVSFAIRTHTILEGGKVVGSGSPFGLFSAAWDVLYSHPAQSSIGWDVIWTTVSFIAWTATKRISDDRALSDVPYLMLTSPFVSVALTGPYILREETGSALFEATSAVEKNVMVDEERKED